MSREPVELHTLTAQLAATAQLAKDMLEVKRVMALVYQALFKVGDGLVHRMDRLEDQQAVQKVDVAPSAAPPEPPRERVDFAKLRRIAAGEEG